MKTVNFPSNAQESVLPAFALQKLCDKCKKGHVRSFNRMKKFSQV